MSQTVIGVTAEQLTTMTITRMAEVESMLARATPVAEFLLSNSKPWKGGRVMLIPFEYQFHSVGSAVRTGFETVNMNFQPTMANMQVTGAGTVRPSAIGLVDKWENAGPAAVIDLATQRAQNSDQGQLEALETQWLQSGVAECADFVSINGDDDTTGLIEGAAVGSQDNTVQNISRATYSTLVGFQNQFKDGAGAFSTGGITGVDSIKAALELSKQWNTAKPQGFCSSAFSRNWFRANALLEQYVNVSGGKQAGGDEYGPQLEFLVRGIKTKVSRFMPNAGTATTTNPWSWLVLDMNKFKFMGRPGELRSRTPWVPMQAAGGLGMIMWQTTAGQLITGGWETSAIFVDAEAW